MRPVAHAAHPYVHPREWAASFSAPHGRNSAEVCINRPMGIKHAHFPHLSADYPNNQGTRRAFLLFPVHGMARLSIREYTHISAVARGIVPVGEEPAAANQTITIGGASVSSAAFGNRTMFVRIHTDVNCSLDWGVAPVAVAGLCDMVAGQTEYFGIVNSTNMKVAVIAS